ncbi:MAG: alpha/beta fold hydrolase [Candidatus Omnitrophota bacterium]
MKNFNQVVFIFLLLVIFNARLAFSMEYPVKTVEFSTSDSVIIKGTLYFHQDTNSRPAVMLFHMWQGSKEDWHAFAQKLQQEGYVVLAIDLRGHGQSNVQKGKDINWQKFKYAAYQDMIKDATAARDFLLQQPGVDLERVGLIGASLGCNVAIQLAAVSNNICSMVLMSPAFNYLGVEVKNEIKNIAKKDISLLVFLDETEQNYASGKHLYENYQGVKELKIYNQKGHGTRLFLSDVRHEVEEKIISWLTHTLSAKDIQPNQANQKRHLFTSSDKFAEKVYFDNALVKDLMHDKNVVSILARLGSNPAKRMIAVSGNVSIKNPYNLLFDITAPLDNYTAPAVLGDTEFITDFELSKEKLIKFLNKPFVRYKQDGSKIYDWYFLINDFNVLNNIANLLEHVDDRLLPAKMINTAIAEYITVLKDHKLNNNTYDQLAEKIKRRYKTVFFIELSDKDKYQLSENLNNYLLSNGIGQLDKVDDQLLFSLSVKFYTLSSTYFYRNWTEVKEFLRYIPPLAAKAKAQNRPLKLKVFACSTGQEPLTFAMALLELGIKDFYILATDYDQRVVEIAEKMTFPEDAFLRVPEEIKQKIMKYFIKVDNGYSIKDVNFFKEHIIFKEQNILTDLPVNLPENFRPPYDLVSVQNVLMYIDSQEVYKNIDKVFKVLNIQGLLILYDTTYNLGSFYNNGVYEKFLRINRAVSQYLFPQGNHLELIRIYKQKLKNEPDIAQYLYLALTYFHNNKLEDAVKTLKKASEDFPYFSVVPAQMSVFYQHTGDIALAIQYMKKAIDMSPLMSAYYGSYIGLLKNKRKVEYYHKIHQTLKLYFQEVAGKIEVTEGAIDIAKEALGIDKNPYIAYLVLGFLYSQRGNLYIKNSNFYEAKSSFQQAISYLKDADRKRPDFYYNDIELGRAYLNYAILMFVNARYKEAEKYMGLAKVKLANSITLETSVAGYDALGYLYYHWGRLKKEIGQNKDALKDFNTAIEYYKKIYRITPDEYKLYVDLGDCYYLKAWVEKELKDYTSARTSVLEARKILNDALELNSIYGIRAQATLQQIEKLIEEL